MKRIRTIAKHTLARNFIAASLTQASNFLPLLLLPTITKRVGIESFGSIAMALAMIQLSLIITDFGYGLSSTYTISKNRDNKNLINSLIGAILLGKVPLTIIACVATALVPFVSTPYSKDTPLFLLSALAITGQSYQTNWLFIGLEKMKSITSYNIITKTLYAIIIVTFVKDSTDSYIVILGWGIAQFTAALLSIHYIYKCGYKIALPSANQTQLEFRNAIPFFISRLAVATYTSAATTIVGLAGPIQAAQFYTCQQIYRIGSAIPVNQVLYPFMAKTGNWRIFTIATISSTTILAISAIGASLFSSEITTELFGDIFHDASDTLKIMLAAMVMSYLAAALGYPAFSAVNKVEKANSTVILASIANLAIIIGLYTLGNITAKNVAIAVLITETVVVLLRGYSLMSILSMQKHER